MSKKHHSSFRYTSFAIKILDKLISPKFNIEGVENIPKKPVLFVANHFTRSETFIIPYIINKHIGRQVRSLADSGLFKGSFGEFLSSTGTVSTKDPRRDKIIVSDLMSGEYDWIIYPEGSMVKSKEIHFKGHYISKTPHGLGRTRTGSTVWALKSELYRDELIKAWEEKNNELLLFYEQQYDIVYDKSLREMETHIVPVNITYYPIRPGKNIIQNTALRFLKQIPEKIAEELEIEGNLLLSANINISFGQAIKISDYSKKSRSIVNQIPLINNKTKNNLIIQYLKYRLTSKFMGDIYFDTKINLDHLFTSVIFNYKEDRISLSHLKNIIYSAAVDIWHLKKYRMSYSIKEENLFKIFSNEPHKEFDGIVELAKSLRIIKESANCDYFSIDKNRINEKHDFHDIRKDNTLQVINNEFILLDKANLAVKRSMDMPEGKLQEEVFLKIFKCDGQNFEDDYSKYFDEKLSKEKDLGHPFFFEGNDKNKKIGIVLCHGYQSSPEELRQMGSHLNGLGFSVYGVRLKGHATAPINMKDVVYQDWYDSFQRGYCALSIICSKIIVVGFSTGGLISLLACAKKPKEDIFAVVSINSALKLQDIRAKFMVPGINLWNDLLSRFNITKATMEYVENSSENPSVNYSRNYLSGVVELGKLMDECDNNLHNIKNPALIIYSKNDPIVQPHSSKIIEEEISSSNKELVEFDMDKHIIVYGDDSDKVFDRVEKFILGLLEKEKLVE